MIKALPFAAALLAWAGPAAPAAAEEVNFGVVATPTAVLLDRPGAGQPKATLAEGDWLTLLEERGPGLH